MTARVLILCCAAALCCAADPLLVGQTRSASCVAVMGPEILGADLARAIPAFREVPPDLSIFPSPLPGAVRAISAFEVQALAARFGVRDATSSEICFRIATEPLTRARVIESMKDSLKIPDLQIEVVDMSNETAPVGRIEFDRGNLRVPATPTRDLPVMWRGDVIYAGDRRFSIWAKVKLTAPITRLVAVESLRAGVPIRADQIREQVTDAFPVSPGREITLSAIDGLVPVKAIAAGTEIQAADLTRQTAVNRGDLVHVEVRKGAARVALTGRAESNGQMGDLVPVRNMESSRVFQARVDGRDSVVVHLDGAGEILQ
ncbi:MAG TPA: flagellar basal body P-ring formation chaperone FlgA [Bryobacteraceae bacterium]|nr:flagellar basal body P-ring formation chaperone FlgA [Bryobacteraceae bacterium]